MAKETEIGKITHYFDKIGVAVVELKGALANGDEIHIKGHTTDFSQNTDSMQIDKEPVDSAKKGDIIGMKVSELVRDTDIVYKKA